MASHETLTDVKNLMTLLFVYEVFYDGAVVIFEETSITHRKKK